MILNEPAAQKDDGAGIVRDAPVRRPQGKGRGKAEPSHAERRHPRRREALLRPPVQPKTVKLQRRGFTAFLSDASAWKRPRLAPFFMFCF